MGRQGNAYAAFAQEKSHWLSLSNTKCRVLENVHKVLWANKQRLLYKSQSSQHRVCGNALILIYFSINIMSICIFKKCATKLALTYLQVSYTKHTRIHGQLWHIHHLRVDQWSARKVRRVKCCSSNAPRMASRLVNIKNKIYTDWFRLIDKAFF